MTTINRPSTRTLVLVPLVAALGLSLTACNKSVSAHGTGPAKPAAAAAAAVRPPSNSTFCGAAHYWVIAENGYVESTGDISNNLHTYVPAEDLAMANMAKLAPTSIKAATTAYAATVHRVATDYAGIDYQVVPDSEKAAIAQMNALQDISQTEKSTQAQETQVVNYVRTVCGEKLESDPNAA